MNPPPKALLAIIVVSILVGAAFYSTSLGEDDDGDGTDWPSGTPFDEEFGNIRVTVGGRHEDSNTNEPYIAIDPNNPLHMVAGGNDYSTFKGDVWVGYYWTWDGGRTWNRSFIPGYDGDLSTDGILSPLRIYSPFGGTGDPVVAFGSGGEVYMAGIAFQRSMVGVNTIWVARSDDGGEHFRWNNIYTNIIIGEGVVAFHDKEWITVDMNNGNVYVTWSWFTTLSRAQIAFTRSTNGGQTWSPVQFISDEFNMPPEWGVQGSQVVVDSDSTIHATWVEFDRDVLRYTYSDDEGISWSDPIDVCDVNPIPYELNNGSYRTPTLPSMKVDTSGTDSDGTIYVTWSDEREGDADVYMVVSPDAGETWGDPYRVNADDSGNDQFFPTITVSPNGELVVAYYDRREDPHNTMLDMYMSASTDQGGNFTDFKITTQSFDGNAGGGSPIGHYTNGSAFIGDYIGAVSNEDYALAIWCDCRNGGTDAADRNSDLYVGRMAFDRLYDQRSN